MPRDMFGEVSDPSVKIGQKQWYTVPLSILAHFAVLFLLVVIPLLATDSLPDVPSMMAFVAAPPPPPPPPAPAAPQPKIIEVPNPNAVPIEAPKEIKPEPPPINIGAGVGVVGGVAGGVPGGVSGGVVGGIPAPPPPPVKQEPVRVGGNVKAPERVKYVPPTYPPIAQSARVSGIVILEAVIGKDGTVTDVKVLKSIPLLDQAALDAVKQWRYTPTTLNGVPVPVIMTVTVNFTLQ